MACAFAPAAVASASPVAPGHVYVETNSPGGNHVVVYNRSSTGQLRYVGKYATGGKGSKASAPLGLPITDSQGAVNLTSDGKLLFAVNTGSNTVTSFRVVKNRLVYADRVLSGGDFPISVTTHGGLLYVLNADPNSSNNGSAGHERIVGYRYNAQGQMTWIQGSARSLSREGMPGAISFDPSGQRLVVTERFAQDIRTFTITSHGTPSQTRVVPSQGDTPFGLAVTGNDYAIVADFGNPFSTPPVGASVSSYNVSGVQPTPVNSASNGQTTSCWVVLNPAGTLAFISSALSGSITEVTIGSNGTVTPNSVDVHTAGPVSLDEALTPSGKFLYVLSGNPLSPGTHDHVEAWSVGTGGALTRIQRTRSILPENASGLAAS
jgi:6-phosphogluconolactonase (cycloisomerase 2 family)